MQPKYVTQTGTGSSAWQIINWQTTPMNFGIAVIATGGVNYTWEYTLEDQSGTYPNLINGTQATATVFALGTLTAGTTSLTSNLTTPIAAWRITKNSGTGSCQAIVLQAGVT